MSVTSSLRITPPALTFLATRRWQRLVERNLYVYRRGWLIIFSGFFEPLFYLLSLGIGVGKLVGDLPGPGGELVDYTAFVAPGLLAASAMNGALMESTFNVFHKLKYAKTYDAVLATPVGVPDIAVGETVWAVIRGSLYTVAFVGVMAGMGLVQSWWGVLAVPATVLLGFAFAAAGVCFTSFMRSWHDAEWVTMALLVLFLFSGVFYPLSTYPDALAWVIRVTPLYQGVALNRGLVLGELDPVMLIHVAYLAVAAVACLHLATRRLGRVLIR